MAGPIEERARVQPEPRSAASWRPSRPYPLVAGCGVLLARASSDDEEQPIVVGTTSAPSTLDPGRLLGQLLGAVPQHLPDVAQLPLRGDRARAGRRRELRVHGHDRTRCTRCELREGLKFSDGHTLDAKAVKYSIDRIRRINVNGGPAGLLGSLDRVETQGDRDVVFHLKKPDATFPFVLATPAMSIVDPEEYPADKLRKGDKITGSGPYTLESYEEGKRAELVRNDDYKGCGRAQERRRHHPLLPGVRRHGHGPEGQEDRRHLPRSRRRGHRRHPEATTPARDVQLVEGAGTEISYLVFNPKDPWAAKAAGPQGRRAAHRPRRDRAQGLQGHRRAAVLHGPEGPHRPHHRLLRRLRRAPAPPRPSKILTDAGITERVPLTLWYTTDRYGSSTKPEFAEIKRQLDDSGLFTITLKSRPWKTFVTGYQKGEYPVFGRGWFPDFPDADNFIAPFVGKKNALGTPYPAPGDHRRAAARAPAARATAARVVDGVRAGPADPRRTTHGCCRCGRASSTSPRARRSPAASGRWTRRRSC